MLDPVLAAGEDEFGAEGEEGNGDGADEEDAGVVEGKAKGNKGAEAAGADKGS